VIVVTKADGLDIDGTMLAAGGGVVSIFVAFITAFFSLRKTVVESTAAENQAFFTGLSDRLKVVEDDLEEERDKTALLRDEVLSLREKLSEAKSLARELDRRNNLLEEERDSLRIRIRELEERIDHLEELERDCP
jgi:peptidoglycan hydrolase CwlO-like protein